MKLHINRKVVPILACVAGVAVVLLSAAGLADDIIGQNRSAEGTADGGYYYAPTKLSTTQEGGVYLGEDYYVPKKHIETVLMLGIDQFKETSDLLYHEQSDFLMLLVLDNDAESYTMLHLNRDTMADIQKLADTGEKLGKYRAQLALAHTFGGSERARCVNTVDAVSNLLYGVNINHYISLTMDAIPILNDEIGGVEVTLLTDFTYLDPSFTEGTTVTLKGDQSLNYVRARMNVADGTNLNRMERQRQYLSSLFEKYRSSANKDFTKALLKVNDYLESDCTIDQLQAIADKMMEYDYLGMQTTEGEATQGEIYIEYNIDEAALQKQIIQLFYNLKESGQA